MDEKTSLDQLLENLTALVRDSEALLAASVSFASDGMQEARSQAEESLRAAKQRLAQFQELLGKARDTLDMGQAYLRDNPWAALICAAGIGVLVGALLARRRS